MAELEDETQTGFSPDFYTQWFMAKSPSVGAAVGG